MRDKRKKVEIKSDSFPEMDGDIFDLIDDLKKLCRLVFRFIESRIKKS